MAEASPRNRRKAVIRNPDYTQRRDRHTTSLLTDHLVITPKFRGKVLKGEVAIECERQIRWVCRQIDVKILQMAVAEDHVHLFIQYPPRLSPSKITEAIKSNTSRELRAKFPHLVIWCPKALWAPGSFHGSVGQGFDVVEKYIKGQRSVPVSRQHDDMGRDRHRYYYQDAPEPPLGEKEE